MARLRPDAVFPLLALATILLAGLGGALANFFVRPASDAGWVIAWLWLPALVFGGTLSAAVIVPQLRNHVLVINARNGDVTAADVVALMGPPDATDVDGKSAETFTYAVAHGTLSFKYDHAGGGRGRLLQITLTHERTPLDGHEI